MSPLLLALLAAGAVLAWPARPVARPARPRAARTHAPARAARRTQTVLVAGVAGLAVAWLVGGAAGPVVGAVAALMSFAVLTRLEPRRARERRERVASQAPLVVDLVAACLASGAGVGPSVRAAARAVGPPVSADLDAVVASWELGADPETAWAAVDPALAGLARAVVRSSRTGAPLADLLPRVSAEARAAHRAQVEARVRTASVRLTAPLGAALLPAFVLLGVVPLVASWLGALL